MIEFTPEEISQFAISDERHRKALEHANGMVRYAFAEAEEIMAGRDRDRGEKSESALLVPVAQMWLDSYYQFKD